MYGSEADEGEEGSEGPSRALSMAASEVDAVEDSVAATLTSAPTSTQVPYRPLYISFKKLLPSVNSVYILRKLCPTGDGREPQMSAIWLASLTAISCVPQMPQIRNQL